jgi:uncharacterized protein involved in exopolysaccharide biosynthesis
MDKIWASVLAERSSPAVQYEETLRTTLVSMWRGKMLILTSVALSLVLGGLVAVLLPKRYTAEAYLPGSFAAPDFLTPARGKNNIGPSVTIDASLLVETRSRLLQSQRMARQVVDRLGLEQLHSEVAENRMSSAYRLLFGARGATNPEYEYDMAAARLLRGLRVKTEPRVYLVTVRYTASDPELAALITNAFVAEFLQTTALDMLSVQRTSAQETLSENLAAFGDKHPNVKMAMARLAALDADVEAQKGAEWSFTLAQANAVPSRPNPWFCIGLALLLGLMGGIALAILAPNAGWQAFHRLRAGAIFRGLAK